MTAHINPYTPVNSVMLEIKRRWAECEMESSVPFERFCDPTPSGKLQWFLALNDCSGRAAGQGSRHYTAHYVRIWKQLASAVVCCHAAKEATEKPLRTLLLQALEHCRAVDDMRAHLASHLRDSHAARVKGGKARHEANRCAWVRAARLISVHRPEAGWKDAAQAARIIEPRLARFVASRRLTLVCESSFRRTIVRWIRNRPIVRAAFEQARRPPAP